MHDSSVERLSPLACQLLTLGGLFRGAELGRALWREVLRASCGRSEPSDAALDTAFRELEEARRVRAGADGALRFPPLFDHDRAAIRRLAAAAFGPVDFAAAGELVRRARRAARLPDDAAPPPDGAALGYLADLRDGVRFAERLDAWAETRGGWPPWGLNGSLAVEWIRDWPAPRPAPIEELFLPWELSAAFMTGRPAGALLDALGPAMGRHAALRCGTAARFLAPVLVWAGRGDLLARLEATDGADGEAVAFARRFFGKGRKGAVSGAGRLWDDGTLEQKALVAMDAALFPPPKPMLMRDISAAAQGERTPAGLRFALLGAQTRWASAPGSDEPIPAGAPPLAWLGRTISHALSPDVQRRLDFPEAPLALAAAEKAAADGWSFLAAQLGGLLAQYPAVSSRALGLAAAAPPDEPLWWSRTEIARPWDPILEALGGALAGLPRAPRPAEARKAADELLSADLALEPARGAASPDGTALHVAAIRPSLARRLRGGGLSSPDRACTWRALRKALVAHSAGLPPETTAALDAWIRRELPHYGSEAHAMEIDAAGRDALLDVLLAAGDAVRLRTVEGGAATDDPEIEVRDFELETEEGPDGSFSFALPPLAWAAEDHPLLVRERGAERRFVWWRVPAALRPFFGLLRDRGGEARRIAVPAGGAAKARAMLLDAAKAGLPVRGAVTPAGAGSALRRAKGGARLVARLDRRDGALRLLLRARPSPDVPDLLFPPGRGKAEIVVAAARKPFLLARDRAAESAAAAAARAALADFEGERDSENDWTAEGPERELALLEALRAAAAAAPDGLDVEWRAAPRDRTVVRDIASARLDGARGADWWLGVTGEFRLDDGTRVALRDLLDALPRRVGGYVPFGERAWLRLSAELRRRLEALAAAGSVRGDELRVSPAALPMLEDAFAPGDAGDAKDGAALPALPGALAEAAGRISAALAAEHPVPEGLAARLRPYQEEGYRWLARLAACGLGGCLADDMGLGKTVQLLALLLERAGDGPSLVVAPASVCGNWCAEAARFAPGLRVVRAADAAALPRNLGPGDLVVASYGLLASRTAQFAHVAWNGAILDEAQAIKNAETQRAEAAKELRAAWRFAATGTPVENRLSDLWSLFDFLDPGFLGTLDSFRARFLDRDGRPLPALRTLVRPLVLRRLKGEVLRDLPPKTEIALAVEPGEAERAAYEALREESVARLHAGGDGDRMRMLAALTRLRRFCCSPSLAVSGAGTGAKLEALEALLAELRENGHRALVFSQFTDVLALVRPILERNGWGYEYLDGATPQKERTRRVEAFQRGAAPFFLVSLKAGGTGLNLTAASYVVLLDPWWNPAVEDQATDRAHRIGQRSAVTVYRLYVRGTVEEKVLALHERKRALSGAVLDGASDAALSEADLLALLRRD